MYQDIAYGQRVGNHKDYGLYWVKSQGYETVVEFYLDSAGPTATGAIQLFQVVILQTQ